MCLFSYMWVGDSHVSSTFISLSGSLFLTLFLHVLDFILSNKNVDIYIYIYIYVYIYIYIYIYMYTYI